MHFFMHVALHVYLVPSIYIYNKYGFSFYVELYIIIFIEFHSGSSELKALVREFRSHALDLLDRLDSSLPIVAKLKVSGAAKYRV